jgi:hypothetical protein
LNKKRLLCRSFILNGTTLVPFDFYTVLAAAKKQIKNKNKKQKRKKEKSWHAEKHTEPKWQMKKRKRDRYLFRYP